MTAIVYDGYTREELSAAFDLVKNRAGWKLPVNVLLPPDADRKLITAAVIFFAGCVPEFITEPGGDLTVTAVGYYAAVGA